MAHATVKGQRHSVRVTQDLTDNFSIEVYVQPKAGTIKREEPFKTWPVPLCLKIRADSKEYALEFGLEHMKKLGTIDDYVIEPSERPPPPAAKPVAKKAADEDADAEAEEAS